MDQIDIGTPAEWKKDAIDYKSKGHVNTFLERQDTKKTETRSKLLSLKVMGITDC